MTEDQYTNQTMSLSVGNGHELWVHDWGNKEAKTIFFFLHGGPGGRCKDKHKLPFDPLTQRVIFHDQRGSGQSTPLGERKHNTTQDLASDITKIADKLGIESFIITGNSWGSTLSLYYAENNPSRVRSVVVSGVWLGTRAEMNNMNNGAWRSHFPDLWDWFVSTVPGEHQKDPASYHFAQINSEVPSKVSESARIYGDMEMGILSLDDRHVPTTAIDYDPSGMLIEMQYMSELCYMSDGYLLKNADKITMPTHIIQGRYDFVCPPENAYALHKAVPHSTITWVTSGHAAEHENITAQKLIYKSLTLS